MRHPSQESNRRMADRARKSGYPQLSVYSERGTDMNALDLILWVLAFACFVIAAIAGPERFAYAGRLVPAGLALASLTFII